MRDDGDAPRERRPFVNGTFSFVHNGEVGIRRHGLVRLPPALVRL